MEFSEDANMKPPGGSQCLLGGLPLGWGKVKLQAARELRRLGRTGKEVTKMIRWTRSARIAPGKFTQAIQWSKEMVEFVNKKYKIQTSVYLDCFGESGTIRWFTDYTDLAALEKVMNQVLADQEYLKKITHTADLFIQGSGYDTVMQAI